MKRNSAFNADDVLYRDKSLLISTARIETKAAGYAVKYVAGIKVGVSHPPRSEALVVFLLSLVALIVLIWYRFTSVVSPTGYLVLVGMTMVTLLIGGYVYWMIPSRFTMVISLINGDSFKIKATSEAKVVAIQEAIRASMALNRQDPLVFGPPMLTKVVDAASG